MGGGNCGWVVKCSDGRSGGLLTIWRENLFEVLFEFSGASFRGICVKHDDSVVYIVDVYSPCHIEGKRLMWQELLSFKNGLQAGDWCIGGNFNAVLSRRERKGQSEVSNSTERMEAGSRKKVLEALGRVGY